jgi:hypothetical protein
MTFTIPIWLLWTLGVPAVIIILLLAFAGAYMILGLWRAF